MKVKFGINFLTFYGLKLDTPHVSPFNISS